MILRSSSRQLSEPEYRYRCRNRVTRESLLARLRAHGSDVGTAIEQGRYIALDAAEALSTFMVNDLPDPVRFLNLLGDLIATAAEAANGGRVAIFGECVDLLSEQGKAVAVTRLEHLWNEVSKLSGTRYPSYTTLIFCAAIIWAPFRARWTARSSNESVQSILPFTPGERTLVLG
jgi:hypothetical protein